MQPEIRDHLGGALEGFPRRIQPCVELSVHHVTEIRAQPEPCVQNRGAPVERRRGADVAMMVGVHERRPPRHLQTSQEIPRPVHEMIPAVNHIRLALPQPLQHRCKRPWLQAVVRVEPHHPIAARAVEALVDRLRHAAVLFGNPDRAGKSRRHLGAAVRRAAIHHQMLQHHALLARDAFHALPQETRVVHVRCDDREIHGHFAWDFRQTSKPLNSRSRAKPWLL